MSNKCLFQHEHEAFPSEVMAFLRTSSTHKAPGVAVFNMWLCVNYYSLSLVFTLMYGAFKRRKAKNAPGCIGGVV